ncbi:hypothetical protein B0H13DRAFT_1857223 [Mycena leptocephala]|nr:hypothetical protein B0H13DRAFT_1857223 [Mycena leptocephala]
MCYLADPEALEAAVIRSLNLSSFSVSPISRLAIEPSFWTKPGATTPNAIAVYARVGKATLDALLKRILLVELAVSVTDSELLMPSLSAPKVFKHLLTIMGKAGAQYSLLEPSIVSTSFQVYVGAYLASTEHALLRFRSWFAEPFSKMAKYVISTLYVPDFVNFSGAKTVPSARRRPADKKAADKTAVDKKNRISAETSKAAQKRKAGGDSALWKKRPKYITNQQLSTVAGEEQKPATTSPESMGKKDRREMGASRFAEERKLEYRILPADSNAGSADSSDGGPVLDSTAKKDSPAFKFPPAAGATRAYLFC